MLFFFCVWIGGKEVEGGKEGGEAGGEGEREEGREGDAGGGEGGEGRVASAFTSIGDCA